MIGTLVAQVTAKAKLAAWLGVALTAGATGGVYAVASAGPPTVTVTTVADRAGSAGQDEAGKQQSLPKQKSGKAKEQGKSDAQGVHGACVSAMARDKNAIGGRSGNHGGAVSNAAHECPKPSAGESAADARKSSDAGKPTGRGQANCCGQADRRGQAN